MHLRAVPRRASVWSRRVRWWVGAAVMTAAACAVQAQTDPVPSPATFFPIADKAERYSALVERMRALPGAVIGNHTWSRPNFHDIAVTEQLQEIDRSDALLRVDVAPAMLFRYPYGIRVARPTPVREALSCGVLSAFRHDMVGHVLSEVRAHRGAMRGCPIRGTV